MTISLAFRLGCDIRCAYKHSAGVAYVYDDSTVRRILALNSRPLAEAPTKALEGEVINNEDILRLFQGGREDLAASLLAKAVDTRARLRERIHPRPPVVVYSTAGDPIFIRNNLRMHLEVFEMYEHDDVAIVVLDDAHANAANMKTALSELSARFGNPFEHLSERTPSGQPGAKALARKAAGLALRDSYGETAEAWIQDHLSEGLPGSANFGFWKYQGVCTIWLDQDSKPYVARSFDSTLYEENGVGFSGVVERFRVVSTDTDLSMGAERVLSEPVDIVHQADWFLDADPRDVTIRSAEAGKATYEDAGYDQVSGQSRSKGEQIRMCTFHACGHRDYRARLNHYLLFSSELSDEAKVKCLQGYLPFYEVLSSSIPSVVVDASKSAFGTAIAFSSTMPVMPMLMLSTSVRLVDFSVGALQRLGGGFSTAWAPVALSHFREGKTSSGRGALAGYMLNEDLAAGLMNCIWTLELNSSKDVEKRLTKAAEDLSLRAAGASPVLSALESRRIYLTMQESKRHLRGFQRHWNNKYCDELESAFMLSANDWRVLHLWLDKRCREELLRYAQQLKGWKYLTLLDPELICACVGKIEGAFPC